MSSDSFLLATYLATSVTRSYDRWHVKHTYSALLGHSPATQGAEVSAFFCASMSFLSNLILDRSQFLVSSFMGSPLMPSSLSMHMQAQATFSLPTSAYASIIMSHLLQMGLAGLRFAMLNIERAFSENNALSVGFAVPTLHMT